MITCAEHLAETLSRCAENMDYRFFEKPGSVNYWGIRGPNQQAGYFDDQAVIVWSEKVETPGGQTKLDWRAFTAPLTTDPGPYYLRKKVLNVKGTAILASPQQMLGAYKIGLHKGYRALVQAKAVNVWRDNTRDEILHWLPDDDGMPGWYGIHHHRGRPKGVSKKTDYYTAGCQVFQWYLMFRAMLDIMVWSMAKHGPVVTYTLVDAKHLGLKL